MNWNLHGQYIVIGAVNADNDDDANSKNIVFTVKYMQSHIPVVISTAKDNQKLSKLPSKEFERSVQVYWNKNKTKSENKNVTNEYRYLQTL